jgi:hypothetical protein
MSHYMIRGVPLRLYYPFFFFFFFFLPGGRWLMRSGYLKSLAALADAGGSGYWYVDSLGMSLCPDSDGCGS